MGLAVFIIGTSVAQLTYSIRVVANYAMQSSFLFIPSRWSANKMCENSIGPGVVKTQTGYRFSVWAPNAQSVSLTGDFNDWNRPGISMQRQDNGVWWCETDDAKCGHEYKYDVTNAKGDSVLKNDPRARLMTNSVGNSVIYDDAFRWEVEDFKPAPIHQRIIYELHIGTFHRKNGEQGTFDSAIEKLDYLASLGVNMIELMPVNEFAGDISWGYNPACPFAVEEAYGGPDGLKRFIDAAHKHGIGIIMDVVYNHFGPSDLDIWQFDGWSENDKGGIYFYNDERSATPWGDTRPDYGRQEVRDYITDNALMWLQEFKADGLRMDMVPFMRTVSGADSGEDDIPEAYELIKGINGFIQHACGEKMTIAEDLHQHDYITDPLDGGGCGYTAQWDAAFVHPVREVLTQSDDENVNLDVLVDALCKQYSASPFARVVYTESHDEVANGKARLVEEVAPGNVDDDYFARQKGVLAATLVLTSAGIPMLFQGQEFKETGWFNDTKDLDWSRRNSFDEYLEAITELVNLRKGEDKATTGLTGANTEVVHRDSKNKVLGYRRFNDIANESVWVYLHLGGEDIDDYQLSGVPVEPHCLFAWSDGLCTQSVHINNRKVRLPSFGIFIFTERGNLD